MSGRELLRRHTRELVVRRRLPRRYGRLPLFVTPDSALQYLNPRLGKPFGELFQIVDEVVSSGDVVWDVGANVGIFALAAAFRAGPTGSTLAIEPDPRLAYLLQRSAQANHQQPINVDVLCVAVSHGLGISRFQIAERGRSSNALSSARGRSQTGGVRYEQLVPTVDLDHLVDCYKIPDVLKIDVEGAEFSVLSNAARLLSEVRPVIYCEVGADLAGEVAGLLHTHGYRLYDGEAPRATRVEIEECVFNTLAIPPDR